MINSSINKMIVKNASHTSIILGVLMFNAINIHIYVKIPLIAAIINTPKLLILFTPLYILKSRSIYYYENQ